MRIFLLRDKNNALYIYLNLIMLNMKKKKIFRTFTLQINTI